MRTVYLIRHAQPDFPGRERLCLGTTDIPLGTEGLARAAELAQTLPPVEAVFSSPLGRALQTARALGQPVQVLPDLREIHMGCWDGLSFREIRTRYAALYEARGKDPMLPVPGQEGADESLQRFAAAMQAAAAGSTGDIAVVAHGGVIAAFLASLGASGEKPGYAQIVPLTYDGSFHI